LTFGAGSLRCDTGLDLEEVYIRTS